jgi:hypothetical protein
VSRIFNFIVLSLLAISLAGMPAASAHANSQTQDAPPCHEMASSQQQEYSGSAVYDDKKGCCDHCQNNQTCSDFFNCNPLSGQNTAYAILSGLNNPAVISNLQKIHALTVSYQGLAIQPEINPPII